MALVGAVEADAIALVGRARARRGRPFFFSPSLVHP